ncbi:MAG TPA: DUF4212 domain-containing protein [Noviherbaspirillum sp.]|uniref:DUF4212 domain-containing protein n=1 Tax=Noviherbaspirillum sp. TaxID=1926288 RepID=UPI002B4A0A88|nr:DUF4212 domain-containing protein [Noviherbaspirillum sp.]HJV83984.1 DUF4212 domain-containing protein [Noviherbaspirillum sp.]
MMPQNTEKMAQLRALYWRKVQRFTAALIIVWFASTFGVIFYARELSKITVFGWPLSFYMAAQGLTFFYLLILALYVKRMRRLDQILKGDSHDGQ